MHRKQRAQEAVREEMGRIILEELHDPRIKFVTITRVEMTDDLRCARIYYSVFGSEKEEKQTIEAMNSASGFIRTLIAERLNFRFAPEVILKLDGSIKYSIEIEKKIEELKNEPGHDTKKTGRNDKKGGAA